MGSKTTSSENRLCAIITLVLSVELNFEKTFCLAYIEEVNCITF